MPIAALLLIEVALLVAALFDELLEAVVIVVPVLASSSATVTGLKQVHDASYVTPNNVLFAVHVVDEHCGSVMAPGILQQITASASGIVGITVLNVLRHICDVINVCWTVDSFWQRLVISLSNCDGVIVSRYVRSNETSCSGICTVLSLRLPMLTVP